MTLHIWPVFMMKNSEYDQGIPQLQTADIPVAPRGRATQQSQDSRLNGFVNKSECIFLNKYILII